MIYLLKRHLTYLKNIESKKLVVFVIGTRPEAIKMAPLIIAFKSNKDIRIKVILTGQHKEMVVQVLKLFNIKSDFDLNLMKINQSLTYINCKVLEELERIFSEIKPNLVLVQGDTTTSFAGGLAAFYQKIPVGHIEAGLRSDDLYDPYPEELNRRLISQISEIHFAPTTRAKENLIKDGITKNIFITGNTAIDALLLISKNIKPPQKIDINWSKNKVILLTVHRRENRGEKLIDITKGITKILEMNNDALFIIPMHRNQEIRKILKSQLGSNRRVLLTEPLDYDEMIFLMKKCMLILTDSGGLQEEAPSFGKPVLVLRDTTERQESIEAGTSLLIGSDSDKIATIANDLLNNHKRYEKMSEINNPYGDGKASMKILDICTNWLK